jgi:HPt (histidine-containing phosphotransfer) domain-containing protein
MQRSLIDQPLFDQGQIAMLLDALGEEDLRAMLSELPAAAGQAFHKIGTALASNDLEEVRRLAHAFKGVASSFGAARLAALAREFELDASSVTSTVLRMPALADAIDETLAALADVGYGPSAGAKA